MPFTRINDFAQQIVFADEIPRLDQASENTSGCGMDIQNVIVTQLLRRNPLWHLTGQNTPLNQKAQHGVDGNFGRHNINAIRFTRQYRVSPGVPYLPVVIKCRRIDRKRLAHENIGKPEVTSCLRITPIGTHHSHVRHKIASEIKRSELNAPLPPDQMLKQTGGNALRCFALVVTGKHAIDVGIVHCPETFSDVHGRRVDTRDDFNGVPHCQQAFLFKRLESSHQLRADVELLNFVASHGAHNRSRFLTLTETIARNNHRLAVKRRHLKNPDAPHLAAPFLSFPGSLTAKTRATSEPGLTTGYSRSVKTRPLQGLFTS